MKEILKGKRVRLRHLTSKDEEKLLAFINNQEVIKYSNVFKPISDIQHRQWFQETMLGSKSIWFGIEWIENDRSELIGTCAIYTPNYHTRSVEVSSLRIGEPKMWKGGYGTEAFILLIEYVLEELNMNRIWVPVYEENQRMIHICEKIGFKIEGTLREHGYFRGRYCNMTILGMLRSEWELIREGIVQDDS